MAVDAFLKLGDIKGESTDSKHHDWIEVLSYSFGVSNTGTMAFGGGGGAGKAEASDFSFMHQYDRASPVLFTKCAEGAHIPMAQLDVVRAGKEQQTFLVIKFENVMISSAQVSGSSEEPVDSISFAFGKIAIEYKQQNPDGSVGAPTEGGWDFEKNKPV